MRTLVWILVAAVAVCGAALPWVAAGEPASYLVELPQPDPLLWLVDGEPRVFLFGTMHVADAEVKERSEVERIAFDQCDTVFTEVLMDEGLQARVQAAIFKHGLMPEGTSLSDLVSKETIETAEELLGNPALSRAIQMFKPAIGYMLVLHTQLEKHAQGADQDGLVLDMQIVEDAKEAGKTTLALETAEDQIKAFVALSLEDQASLFESAVEDLAEAEAAGIDALEALVDVYQAGDPEELLALTDDGDEISAKFMRVINDERNEGMTEGIVAWMKANPEGCAWVAVGSLHMPGENGIVERLRRIGYTVTRVRAKDVERVAPLEAVGAR